MPSAVLLVLLGRGGGGVALARDSRADRHGFLTGPPDADRVYVADSRGGHVWIEVAFEGAGWVAFDPTPTGARQRALFSADGARPAGLERC